MSHLTIKAVKTNFKGLAVDHLSSFANPQLDESCCPQSQPAGSANPGSAPPVHIGKGSTAVSAVPGRSERRSHVAGEGQAPRSRAVWGCDARLVLAPRRRGFEEGRALELDRSWTADQRQRSWKLRGGVGAWPWGTKFSRPRPTPRPEPISAYGGSCYWLRDGHVGKFWPIESGEMPKRGGRRTRSPCSSEDSLTGSCRTPGGEEGAPGPLCSLGSGWLGSAESRSPARFAQLLPSAGPGGASLLQVP